MLCLVVLLVFGKGYGRQSPHQSECVVMEMVDRTFQSLLMVISDLVDKARLSCLCRAVHGRHCLACPACVVKQVMDDVRSMLCLCCEGGTG